MPPTNGTRKTPVTKPNGSKAARAAVVKEDPSEGRSTEVVGEITDQAMCAHIHGIWTPPKGGKAGYCTVPRVGAQPGFRINVFRGDPCHRQVFGNEEYILVPYTAELMADLKENYKKIG